MKRGDLVRLHTKTDEGMSLLEVGTDDEISHVPEHSVGTIIEIDEDEDDDGFDEDDYLNRYHVLFEDGVIRMVGGSFLVYVGEVE